MTKIKVKKIKLGIVGGGSGSWIGHVHRIAARFDDQYEIVSGVFSRNTKNLQPTDYLALLTGITTLLWIWFPKEKI